MRTLKLIQVIVSLAIFSSTLSGCALWFDNNDVQELPLDVPLSEFILGKWEAEAGYDDDRSKVANKIEVYFEDWKTVKLVSFSSDGKFLDGDTLVYIFMNEDTILVDSLRIPREQWILERDGQHLIIHRNSSTITIHYTLIRIANKNNCTNNW